MLHYSNLHVCFRVALTKARALQVSSSYHPMFISFRFRHARNQREDPSISPRAFFFWASRTNQMIDTVW